MGSAFRIVSVTLPQVSLGPEDDSWIGKAGRGIFKLLVLRQKTVANFSLSQHDHLLYGDSRYPEALPDAVVACIDGLKNTLKSVMDIGLPFTT